MAVFFGYAWYYRHLWWGFLLAAAACDPKVAEYAPKTDADCGAYDTVGSGLKACGYLCVRQDDPATGCWEVEGDCRLAPVDGSLLVCQLAGSAVEHHCAVVGILGGGLGTGDKPFLAPVGAVWGRQQARKRADFHLHQPRRAGKALRGLAGQDGATLRTRRREKYLEMGRQGLA